MAGVWLACPQVEFTNLRFRHSRGDDPLEERIRCRLPEVKKDYKCHTLHAISVKSQSENYSKNRRTQELSEVLKVDKHHSTGEKALVDCDG